MSTRSIILVTGSNGLKYDRTVRLYKHSDGYPTGNLPIIADALQTAVDQCSELSKRFEDYRDPLVEQVVGLLLGAATSPYGMGARIDQEDEQGGASYQEKFKPKHLGNQWDLEWIYVIDLKKKAVNVYGGGYDDCSPQDHYKKGMVDPVKYADQLKVEYQNGEREEIRKAIESIEKTGFTVNKRPPKPSGPKGNRTSRKPAKGKSKVVSIKASANDSGNKTNAIVEIVYDPSKRKLRAYHDGGWVRFPKKLRIEGYVYMVETLKPGASGSWITKGEITRIAS